MSRRLRILPGSQYGHLTVIRDVDTIHGRKILCACACGNEHLVTPSNLSRTKSCGCRRGDAWARRSTESRADFSTKGNERLIEIVRSRSKECDDGRVCLICREFKTWDQFGNNNSPKSQKRHPAAQGKKSHCIECERWSSIKRWSITKDEWYQILDAQEGVCALCGELNHDGRALHVDHDHSCCGPDKACQNCIRGLLCISCNRMIGLAEKKLKLRKLFGFYLDSRPLLLIRSQLNQTIAGSI